MVILISAFVYRSLESALYAGITIFISSRVIDAILYGTDAGTGKFILIISEKNEEIARDILGNIERGVTRLQAKGGYSGRNGEVLLCAVRRYEVAGVKEIIHAHDPAAFVIVGEPVKFAARGFAALTLPQREERKNLPGQNDSTSPPFMHSVFLKKKEGRSLCFIKQKRRLLFRLFLVLGVSVAVLSVVSSIRSVGGIAVAVRIALLVGSVGIIGLICAVVGVICLVGAVAVIRLIVCSVIQISHPLRC